MAAKLPYFVLHFTVCLVWKLLFTYMIIIILELFHNSSMNQFRAIVRPYFTYFDACTFGACIIIILPPMPPSILTAHPNKLHVLSFAALRAVMPLRGISVVRNALSTKKHSLTMKHRGPCTALHR